PGSGFVIPRESLLLDFAATRAVPVFAKEFAMLNRRQFLTRALQGSALFAAAPVVPQFGLNSARAAEVGKDTVLVVVELAGGNDGLNTVVPYADDLYHKARPTLRFTKDKVIKLDDHVGLHPGLNG